MATAGTLINTAALTFVGGGTALANVLSATAVSSAVGLGLAAYALTRPQESSGGGGYGHEESSGYHKRQGLAVARSEGEVPNGARVVAVRERKRQGKSKGGKGSNRESKVSAGETEVRSSRGRKGKNSEGRPDVGRLIVDGKLVGKLGKESKNRSKREQQDIELGPLAVLQNEEKLELQETLELIRQHDTAGCGKRLMCELGGTNQDQLTIEELSILNLVRPSGNDGRGPRTTNQASLEYLDAKTRGQKGEKCGNVYPLCTLNGRQLMTIVMDYLP